MRAAEAPTEEVARAGDPTSNECEPGCASRFNVRGPRKRRSPGPRWIRASRAMIEMRGGPQRPAGAGPRKPQPFGSTMIVTSGVMPDATLMATL
jgi:hypothetical protein